jgi:hypothetical protein
VNDILTVQGLGWAGVTNGELLRRATAHADALLTMDRKLERQHHLSNLSFGVVVVQAHTRLIDAPFAPKVSLRNSHQLCDSVTTYNGRCECGYI